MPPAWQRLDGLRALVLDDEVDARELAAAVLTMAGARVCSADSVHVARQVLGRERPDIVVTDLAMHAEDGWSFIEWLRGLPADAGGRTPAVALTALTSDEARARSARAGIERYLTKPIHPAELVSAVATLVQRV